MANILYEPASVRMDSGILYITAFEPCNIPFIFDINKVDNSGNDNIQESDIMVFTIKTSLSVNTPVLTKVYNKIKNNIAVLSLTQNDMKILLGGNEYILSAKLYHVNGQLKRVLIKRLQIKVQEVV